MRESTESIRARVLALIESEYDSDAAFERSMSLRPKTVSNWRLGRSASFMTILPLLCERFGVNVGELLDIPLSGESSELSDEEVELLTLYRKTHVLPKKMRRALKDTLESTINMYITAGEGSRRKTTVDKSKKI